MKNKAQIILFLQLCLAELAVGFDAGNLPQDPACPGQSLTLGKGTPEITAWPQASSISYGQALSAAVLSGAVVVTPGNFAFTRPLTQPNAGTANHSVTFTPTDTLHYRDAVANVSVTVHKVTPAIIAWPIADTIPYGQTLSSVTLSRALVVTPGTFAFNSPFAQPNPGTAKYLVTFTPEDDWNYQDAESSVSVTVSRMDVDYPTRFSALDSLGR